jgi:hypothetical protein
MCFAIGSPLIPSPEEIHGKILKKLVSAGR